MDALSRQLMGVALKASPNSTLSPASAAGLLPSSSLGGPRTAKSGPAPVPASHTVPRASKKAMRTRGISGPISSALSPRDALSSSLASRLRARLSTVGSIEYTQTWKESVTPSGRRYWAHTASARTIYVNVSTGELLCAGVNTPRASDGSNGGPNQANGALSADAAAAAWPLSPSPSPSVGGAFDVMKAIRENLNPKAKLRDWALVAGFPTTNAGNVKGAYEDPILLQKRKDSIHQNNLQDIVQYAPHGPISDIFFVPTGRRVVLAPEFSLWLMGYAEAWVTAAPGAKDWLEAQAALESECSKDQATPLCPSLPPNS